jgi:hypothetical protein
MVIPDNWIESVEIDIHSTNYIWDVQKIQKLLHKYDILSTIITQSNTCVLEYNRKHTKSTNVNEILEILYKTIMLPMSAWVLTSENNINIYEYPNN